MSGTTSRQFQAVISVDDRTAGPLAAIAIRLRAIAGMSGMDRIRASALNAQRALGSFVGTVGRLATVAGVAAGGAAVGFVAAMNSAASLGGELSDLADRLGISVEDIQAYGFAFAQSGANSETFIASMERLNRGLSDAAAGRNQQVASLFQRLGISLRGANGQIRTAADVLPQLAEAFKRNENGALRTRMAMLLFGRAGGPLITGLVTGSEGLREQTARWRELDGQVTSGNVNSLDAVGDSMNEVTTSLLGVRNAIAVRLVPVLAPLLSDLATWIASNRELIATRVEEWVRAVADFIKTIDFTKLREDFAWFLGEAQRIYEAIGGWKTIAIATAAYLTGPFVASIAVLALAITTTLMPVLTRATTLLAGLGAKGAVAAAARLAGAAPAVAAAGAPAAAAGAGGSWLAGAAGAGRAALAFAGTAANLAGIAAAAGMILGSAEDPEVRRRSRERLDAGANGAQRIPDELWNAPDDGPAPGAGGSWWSRLPSLFGSQSGQGAAAQPPQGEVRLHMTFDNVPPGARVQAETRGSGVQAPELDVGYASMGAY